METTEIEFRKAGCVMVDHRRFTVIHQGTKGCPCTRCSYSVDCKSKEKVFYRVNTNKLEKKFNTPKKNR